MSQLFNKFSCKVKIYKNKEKGNFDLQSFETFATKMRTGSTKR